VKSNLGEMYVGNVLLLKCAKSQRSKCNEENIATNFLSELYFLIKLVLIL
jgi:hypothetical protein